MFSNMQDNSEISENIFSEKPLPGINKRVRELIEYYTEGSVMRFSEMIGISSSQKLNRVFNIDKRNGEYPEVSSNILISIANKFRDLNLRWLLTGSENMFSGNLKGNIPQNNDIFDSEIKLYKTLLDEKDKKIIEQAKEIGRLEAELKMAKNTIGHEDAEDVECAVVAG